MIRYETGKLDTDTTAQLIELSRVWVQENCSYGMVVNEPGDLAEPLIVALDGRRIVGYIFGHFYRQENKTSYIEIGSYCFSVDELYVLPQYRGQGVGKNLFRILEKQIKAHCTYITLTTPTKNYEAILKFYIEELGMDFFSAFLIKRTAACPQEVAK